jgi:exopolyphosphatase/guanosine-5'-triphosphate,3'-diphosphate pyrophosphatase
MKLAAIDIGSNAIRLLIEEIYEKNGEFKTEKVSLTRVPVRLGEDVFTQGKLGKEKMDQLSKTMLAFKHLMDVHQVAYFRVCATSAMREAQNKKEIFKQIKKQTQLEIEILSGQDEADLIFSNYINQNLNHNGNYLYIDVGGGSTELTVIQEGKRYAGKSFPIGTVRSITGKVKDKSWSDLENWLDKFNVNTSHQVAIGTGGNINTASKILGKKPNQTVHLQELKQLLAQLEAISFQDRITEMRMKPDRADVILPALAIYVRIMEKCSIHEIMVPKVGLSDGIILDMFLKWLKSQSLGKKFKFV